MKFATFNANSIRARLDITLDWLAENEPDLLAIQETKVEDDKFPVSDFEDAGWHVAIHGQKSYNGVALVTREPLGGVTTGFGDPLMPEDCRIIAVDFQGIQVINTYVPNGSAVGSEKFEYKLKWLAKFGEWVSGRYSPDQPVLWMGDINIARKPEDVFDSARMLNTVGHHPDEFAALDRITDWGFADMFRKFTEGAGHYTFWEFVIPKAFERNIGWRIDHVYATPGLANLCTSCVIDKEPRTLEKPSDHTFVVAEFDY